MSIVVKIVILHELASKFNIKLNIILHYYSRSSFIDGKKKKTHDESKSYIWIISFPWKRFKEVFLSHFFSRFIARRPEKPKDYGSENFV